MDQDQIKQWFRDDLGLSHEERIFNLKDLLDHACIDDMCEGDRIVCLAVAANHEMVVTPCLTCQANKKPERCPNVKLLAKVGTTL